MNGVIFAFITGVGPAWSGPLSGASLAITLQKFMKHTQLLIRNYAVIFNIVLIIFLSAGCSLKEIHEQTSLTDNLGSIKGIIKVTSDQTGPVMVLHFRDQNGIPALQRTLLASGDGQYEFYAEPGKHYVAAFVDVNKDGKYQPEEHGNYLGAPAVIEVVGRQIVKIEAITISGAVPSPPTGIKPIDRTLAVWKNIGSVVAIDDPRFTSENYTLGLWKRIPRPGPGPNLKVTVAEATFFDYYFSANWWCEVGRIVIGVFCVKAQKSAWKRGPECCDPYIGESLYTPLRETDISRLEEYP